LLARRDGARELGVADSLYCVSWISWLLLRRWYLHSIKLRRRHDYIYAKWKGYEYVVVYQFILTIEPNSSSRWNNTYSQTHALERRNKRKYGIHIDRVWGRSISRGSSFVVDTNFVHMDDDEHHHYCSDFRITCLSLPISKQNNSYHEPTQSAICNVRWVITISSWSDASSAHPPRRNIITQRSLEDDQQCRGLV